MKRILCYPKLTPVFNQGKKTQNKDNKRLGIGSIAVLLVLFASIISFFSIDGLLVGEYMFGTFIPTQYISIILFIIALYLSCKFKSDYGARIGKVLSIVCLIWMCILLITGYINFNNW
ncbi:hypothetical protein [Clostridium chrysemydis]|uniref:hypothetical protein n=1 Tax=Clostridium chrysemydis TaxID=2665504 RepID=UPI00188458AA|nr:hypothetical protein [Clostridium chrysemydis]